MSTSNGGCKALLKDKSFLEDNMMDYNSNIDNLKSILNPINNRKIAEAIILTINKFSSKCVVTNEESTSTIKLCRVRHVFPRLRTHTSAMRSPKTCLTTFLPFLPSRKSRATSRELVTLASYSEVNVHEILFRLGATKFTLVTPSERGPSPGSQVRVLRY
jgi:hypothetical protein